MLYRVVRNFKYDRARLGRFPGAVNRVHPSISPHPNTRPTRTVLARIFGTAVTRGGQLIGLFVFARNEQIHPLLRTVGHNLFSWRGREGCASRHKGYH